MGLDKASLSGDWARWARGSTAWLRVMWNGLGKDGLGRMATKNELKSHGLHVDLMIRGCPSPPDFLSVPERGDVHRSGMTCIGD